MDILYIHVTPPLLSRCMSTHGYIIIRAIVICCCSLGIRSSFVLLLKTIVGEMTKITTVKAPDLGEVLLLFP